MKDPNRRYPAVWSGDDVWRDTVEIHLVHIPRRSPRSNVPFDNVCTAVLVFLLSVANSHQALFAFLPPLSSSCFDAQAQFVDLRYL